MGVKLTIAGYDFQAENYNVTEEVNALGAGDTTGGVGVISVSIPSPFDREPLESTLFFTDSGDLFSTNALFDNNNGTWGDSLEILGDNGNGTWTFTSLSSTLDTDNPIARFGVSWLKGKNLILKDTPRGVISGVVETFNESRESGVINLTCLTRLSLLNVYGVKAEPFIGTLEGAFNYYCSLANITTGIEVDSAIASRPVNYIGFEGELWLRIKQMATAQGCDIVLKNDVITLQPARGTTLTPGYDLSRAYATNGSSLAQNVEVYCYGTQPIVNTLVYPVGGWDNSVEVLTVNTGETEEYTLELSSSVTSINQPVMQTFVSKNHSTSSVYTIVADDGLPVPVGMWNSNGGSLTVEIDPSTTSLKITLVGATNIPLAGGGFSKSFAVALASDTSGNRYSTLRIVGTGVSFNRDVFRVPTGVNASLTATEVGETIDNPFIVDVNTAISTGVNATMRWNGLSTGLSGATSVVYPFGGVASSRVWDSRSRKYYRVRSASVDREVSSFNMAEVDVLWSDYDSIWVDKTYQEWMDFYSGMTYADVVSLGLVSP